MQIKTKLHNLLYSP